jgi:hypothetical protein
VDLLIRTRTPWRGLPWGAAGAVAGCTSILGVHDPSLQWCLRPENAHAFCEDFDHPDPLAAWQNAPTPPHGTDRKLLASDDSPPNLLDTNVQALSTGQAALTGLENSFSQETFDHVVVGVDVRIVAANFFTSGDIASGIGFLLVEDTSSAAAQPNLCIGLALAPVKAVGTIAVALVLAPNPTDCFTVDNLMTGDGESGDGGASGSGEAPTPIPLAEILTNEWQHIVLDVRRDPSGDGSGTLTATLASAGALPEITIPAGSLAPGFPQIGVATSVSGPSGEVEIQFDNITVDFP